jgi:hypothetical protein
VCGEQESMTSTHIVFHHCAPNTIVGYVQFVIYYIPLIVGLLFLASNHRLLSDVTTMSFAVGVFLNNVMNSSLRAFFKLSRPGNVAECIPNDFGMPARESQQLLCYVAIDLVFAHLFSNGDRGESGIKIKRVGVLLSLVAISSWVYIDLGYYTVEQVLVGALVGAANGFLIVSFVVLILSPFLPAMVQWWNTFCDRHHWIPHRFQCAHIFHYHPGMECDNPSCTIPAFNKQLRHAQKCCTIAPQKFTQTTPQFFPFELLCHVCLKLTIFLLHHFV